VELLRSRLPRRPCPTRHSAGAVAESAESGVCDGCDGLRDTRHTRHRFAFVQVSGL